MVQMLFHIGLGCGTYDGRRYIEHQSDSRASSDAGRLVARLGRTAKTLHSCDSRPLFYWYDYSRNRPTSGEVVIQRWDLSVVLSGSPWPYPDNFSYGTVSHSGIESNVENGVGFIGGIYRRDAMYETCELVPRPAGVTHCELTYDSRSAVLEGVLRLTPQSRNRLPEDIEYVTLSELDGNRVRLVQPDYPEGYFRFGAIEPGRRYRLLIERPSWPTYEEIIVMGPAERRTLDIELEGTPKCRVLPLHAPCPGDEFAN
jgi:hypothetical protein